MNKFFRTIIRAAIPAVVAFCAVHARAETYVFEADTITATPIDDNGVVGYMAVCDEGDPLCSPEFICRDDGNGRTCETVDGWVARAYAANHYNTVGPKGWR